MDQQRWLSYGDFAPHLGETFEVDAVPLELAEVTDLGIAGGAGPDGAARQQFSLLFKAPAAPALEQRIHQVRHPDLGELELFLVPVGPYQDGVGYEAAFA